MFLENIRKIKNERSAYAIYILDNLNEGNPKLMFNDFVDSEIGKKYISFYLRQKKLNRILK